MSDAGAVPQVVASVRVAVPPEVAFAVSQTTGESGVPAAELGGMTMLEGPWFFDSFGGGWRFAADGEGTRATWKYTWTTRPRWLRPIAEPLGRWLLGREIRARIAAFARACADPEIVESTGVGAVE